jgi:hypothetical protein
MLFTTCETTHCQATTNRMLLCNTTDVIPAFLCAVSNSPFHFHRPTIVLTLWLGHQRYDRHSSCETDRTVQLVKFSPLWNRKVRYLAHSTPPSVCPETDSSSTPSNPTPHDMF